MLAAIMKTVFVKIYIWSVWLQEYNVLTVLLQKSNGSIAYCYYLNLSCHVILGNICSFAPVSLVRGMPFSLPSRVSVAVVFLLGYNKKRSQWFS